MSYPASDLNGQAGLLEDEPDDGGMDTDMIQQTRNGDGGGTVKQFQVKVPAELHRRLKTATSARDMTMRDLFMELVEGWLADKSSGQFDGQKGRSASRKVR